MHKIIKKVIDAANSIRDQGTIVLDDPSKELASSDLMMKIFKEGGLSIPRQAADQAKIGPQMDLEELMPGDMVFFTDEPGNEQIKHVGLITRVNHGRQVFSFIHSPAGGKVTESELMSAPWKSVFLQATRPSAFMNLDSL